jgi:hypothetical protein
MAVDFLTGDLGRIRNREQAKVHVCTCTCTIYVDICTVLTGATGAGRRHLAAGACAIETASEFGFGGDDWQRQFQEEGG